MNEQQRRILEEWIEETERAKTTLHLWSLALQVWHHVGGETEAGEFDRRLAELRKAGFEAWADRCQAGGGLDALAEAVEVER